MQSNSDIPTIRVRNLKLTMTFKNKFVSAESRNRRFCPSSSSTWVGQKLPSRSVLRWATMFIIRCSSMCKRHCMQSEHINLNVHNSWNRVCWIKKNDLCIYSSRIARNVSSFEPEEIRFALYLSISVNLSLNLKIPISSTGASFMLSASGGFKD